MKKRIDEIDELYEDWNDNIKNFLREMEEQKLDEEYIYDLYSFFIAGLGLIAIIPYFRISFLQGLLVSFFMYWLFYFIARFLIFGIFYEILRDIQKWLAKFIIIFLPFILFVIIYCIVKM